jgi:TrkA domain protein
MLDSAGHARSGATVAIVGVRIERVDLPGIGVRNDILTREGRRLSIITHRTGEREIALHDVDDPDSCTFAIPLTDDEATTLGEILGASVTLSRITGLGDAAPGLYTEEISLPAGSEFIGRPMGDTKARTKTGSSIVAIARGHEVIASPGPETIFEAGDVVVAVGTRKGLDALTEIIDRGPR